MGVLCSRAPGAGAHRESARGCLVLFGAGGTDALCAVTAWLPDLAAINEE